MFHEIRDMQAEKAEMDEFYQRAMTGSFITFVFLTLMVILFSVYLPGSFTKPIKDLVDVTDRISKGDLTVRSSNDSGDEVGCLRLQRSRSGSRRRNWNCFSHRSIRIFYIIRSIPSYGWQRAEMNEE